MNMAKTISDGITMYKEHGDETYKHEFEFAGYSILDSSSVFSEFLTVFSISRGIIHDRHFRRFVNGDGSIYVNLVR